MRFAIYVPTEVDDIYLTVMNILKDFKIRMKRISVETWHPTVHNDKLGDYSVYKYECQCLWPRFLWLRHKWQIERLRSKVLLDNSMPCYTFVIEPASE